NASLKMLNLLEASHIKRDDFEQFELLQDRIHLQHIRLADANHGELLYFERRSSVLTPTLSPKIVCFLSLSAECLTADIGSRLLTGIAHQRRCELDRLNVG